MKNLLKSTTPNIGLDISWFETERDRTGGNTHQHGVFPSRGYVDRVCLMTGFTTRSFYRWSRDDTLIIDMGPV